MRVGPSIRGIWTALSCLVFCGSASRLPALEVDGPRRETSLSGTWSFQREGAGANEWKDVQVPSSFESHEGTKFDGVGRYRRSIGPLRPEAGRRVLLHFEAAATECEVWLDGERLGSHLGGWTPFRFDITEILRKRQDGEASELLVRLDEKVGHNSQGFLPIVAPHFGGIWQEVKLIEVPEVYIDDLGVLAVGEPATKTLRLEIPVVGAKTDVRAGLEVHLREPGSPAWQTSQYSLALSRWSLSLPPGQDLNASANPAANPAANPFVDPSAESLFIERRDSDFHWDGKLIRLGVGVSSPRLWSPGAPNLYDVRIVLAGALLGRGAGDSVSLRAAFRSIEVFGDQLRLNGKPIGVRGVLDWGYSPPLLAPDPGEASFRRDLEFLRDRGFNLLKFCLWMPPRRFLELADEMGILAWMEYPTWHPDLTPKHLGPLREEFAEFFRKDRNHPCIILRSLTCETGHGADLAVIRELYDMAHAMVPGAVVEDDSSWIGWNRIHDFWDDHPYGNNHGWVDVLRGFREHILAHGLKPLVLGEAIAADTWVEPKAILEKVGEDRPFWAPGFLDDSVRWLDRMRGLHGPRGVDRLVPDSLRYAFLMRKFQIEAYRREIPYGGYVVSVIRDFPLAAMGLIDFLERPKWTPEEWAWQRSTMLLLSTAGDRRSFRGGETLAARLLLSHFGPEELRDGSVDATLRWEGGEGVLGTAEAREISRNPGTLGLVCELAFALPEVESPRRAILSASLDSPGGRYENSWPLWVVPVSSVDLPGRHAVRLDPSIADSPLARLFPEATRFGGGGVAGGSGEVGEVGGSGDAGGTGAAGGSGEVAGSGTTGENGGTGPAGGTGIVVASRFSDGLLEHLEKGGRALLLPDGGKDSPPLSAHWFLRGAPYVPEHPAVSGTLADLLVDLQHFDLAGDVIPQIEYLECIDPLLLLWDTHDLKLVKTHGLVFEAGVGSAGGRLLVSTLRHGGTPRQGNVQADGASQSSSAFQPGGAPQPGGTDNAAGRWLLGEFLSHLERGPAPRRALSAEVLGHIRDKLHEETMPLVEKTWRFKPEAADAESAPDWASPTLALDPSWSEIRIGAAWEGQGFVGLDGWAWYRIEVAIPESWRGRQAWLSFEGVDDIYELYVGGRLVARRGDIAKRIDAFNERFSHRITEFVTPGKPCVIAIRVHDWYGSGGIFRPVTLSTAGFSPAGEIVR